MTGEEQENARFPEEHLREAQEQWEALYRSNDLEDRYFVLEELERSAGAILIHNWATTDDRLSPDSVIQAVRVLGSREPVDLKFKACAEALVDVLEKQRWRY